MTRKDFIAVAIILRDNRPAIGETDTRYFDIVYALANLFGDDNPRFERDRWFRFINTRKGGL